MSVETDVKQLIRKTLPKAISYDGYKFLVSNLISEGKSTGYTQTEDYLNYSKLSERRMKRWDKVFKLNDEDKAFLNTINTPITFLTISEGWCGDEAHALPILNKIAEYTPEITLKIVFRDENDALMEQFLTNGSKSIPKLIALDEKLNVLFTWGARPSIAKQMVFDYKEKHGKLTPEFKEDLQKWYNKDKGRTIVEDIINELKSL